MLLELNIKKRIIFGKKVKNLRRAGLIPAEIYGHGATNRHVAVSASDFEKIYKTAGTHTVITLTSREDNNEKTPAIIALADRDPIKNTFRTIDFHAVKMDEEIHAHVPILLTGEAPAVKAGLLLVRVMNEIEVVALPAHIPHAIEIDITHLEKNGDALHVSDINLPKTVASPISPETVIASVMEKKEGAEEAPRVETEPKTETAEQASESETATQAPHTKTSK